MNKATLKIVGRLYTQLLEFAEHGDYSNGNVEYGVDEGRVRAQECLEELRRKGEDLLNGKMPE